MNVTSMKPHPAADIFPMLDSAELAALSEDIKKNGLQHPVVLIDAIGEWQILDGRNRARACQMAGVMPSHVIVRGVDPVAYVLSANLKRRHLNESQRGMVALAVEKLYAAEATAKKSEAGKSFGKGHPKLPADLPEPKREKGEARTRAAEALSVSPRLVQDAKKVDRHGSRPVVEAVRNGKVAIGDAVRVVGLPRDEQTRLVEMVAAGEAKTLKDARNKAVRADVSARIEAEPAPLPGGPFRVIVADPPWRYDTRAEDPTHRGANPYPSMSTDDICAMPVPDIACDDAVLWLWTTNAFMRDAFRVLDAWGFKEKTILTWVKDRMGTGDWLRGQTEHCIMAVRGSPFVKLTNQTTVLHAAMREHSRKPDEFYAMVDGLCLGSKVELFAREARQGWSAWGAEASKFDGEAAE